VSFDLSVFRAPVSLTVEEAAQVHAALCKGEGTSLVPAAEEDLASLYQRIVARLPELEDDEERSPFASSLERSAAGLVLPIAYSRAGEVLATVGRLAAKLGLTVFDPQAGVLHRPEAPPPAAPLPRLPRRKAENTLLEGLTPRLQAHGFARSGKAKELTFRRVLPGDFAQTYAFQILGSNDLRVSLRVQQATLGERLARMTGSEAAVDLVWADQLGPFRDRDGQITDRSRVPQSWYSICHAPCVEQSVRDATSDLDSFVLPFFDRAASLAGLDHLYNDDLGSSRPRHLHRGGLMGPLPLYAVVGTAVAQSVGRSNLAACVEHYRELVTSLGPPAQLALRADAYDAFVMALL
jgi:hypothetical protein